MDNVIPLKKVKKTFRELFNGQTKAAFTSSVKGQKTQELNIDTLANAMNKVKRMRKHIYILEQSGLPDDCYGILMLRPEDAEQWRDSDENSK